MKPLLAVALTSILGLAFLAPGCGGGKDSPDAGAADAGPGSDAAALADASADDAGDAGFVVVVPRDGGCALDDRTWWQGTFTLNIDTQFSTTGTTGTSENTIKESSSIEVSLRQQAGSRQRTWTQETAQDVIGAGSFDDRFLLTMTGTGLTDNFHIQGSAQGIQMSSAYPPCPGLPVKVNVNLDTCTYSFQFPCVEVEGTFDRSFAGQPSGGDYTREIDAYMSGEHPLPPGPCPRLQGSVTDSLPVAVLHPGHPLQYVDGVITWDLSWPDCQ